MPLHVSCRFFRIVAEGELLTILAIFLYTPEYAKILDKVFAQFIVIKVVFVVVEEAKVRACE